MFSGVECGEEGLGEVASICRTGALPYLCFLRAPSEHSL